MVKILYGLCSVGIGHAIRAKEIIGYLEQQGHEVFVITSYKAYAYLSKYVSKVYNIEGAELIFKNNNILSCKTFWRNITKLNPNNYAKLAEVKKVIEEFKPELVISDWETVSTYFARNLKLPLLSIDNQAFLRYGNYKVPFKYWCQYILARCVLRFLVRKSDYSLVIKFPEMQMEERPNIISCLPLVKKEIKESHPKRGKHIIVYDSTKTHNKLMKILKDIKENFIVYGYDRVGEEGNMTFKMFDDSEAYIKDLFSCKAIITNAGFTLLSEAIYLGKPILCIPIKKHFEQTLNSIYIKEHELGETYNRLNVKNIKKFLKNCEKYRKHRMNYETDLFIKLDGLIKEAVKK